MKGRRKIGGTHYYPALLKPFHYTMDGCDHNDVNVDDTKGPCEEAYRTKLIDLSMSRGATDYNYQRKITGISRPSLISGLSPQLRLPITSTFAGGCMHMPTLNLGDLFLGLWRGSLKCESTDDVATWDRAVLQGQIWKIHGDSKLPALPPGIIPYVIR